MIPPLNSKFKLTSCFLESETECEIKKPNPINKQRRLISSHQIGLCAVQLVNRASPRAPLRPIVTLKSQTEGDDQMDSFLFISDPAGLGLVAGQFWGVAYIKDML